LIIFHRISNDTHSSSSYKIKAIKGLKGMGACIEKIAIKSDPNV